MVKALEKMLKTFYTKDLLYLITTLAKLRNKQIKYPSRIIRRNSSNIQMVDGKGYNNQAPYSSPSSRISNLRWKVIYYFFIFIINTSSKMVANNYQYLCIPLQ